MPQKDALKPQNRDYGSLFRLVNVNVRNWVFVVAASMNAAHRT